MNRKNKIQQQVYIGGFVPVTLAKKLKAMSEKLDLSASWIIRRAVEMYLKNKEGK